MGFLLTCGIISLFAQTETRTVPAYNEIEVCCGIDINLSEGPQSDLKIEVNDPKLLSALRTEVVDNKLILSYDSKKYKRPKSSYIRIYTSIENLSSIQASSGSDVFSKTPLKATEIRLSATSGADIELELNARKVECTTNSGSHIILKGKAAYANLKASSGSDIDLSKMTVMAVDANASSGSDIIVDVTESLNGKASSGSDVIYTGNPRTVNRNQSSGGKVKAED